MKLIFERTGERRYNIQALREGMPTAIMDPAPGYDPLLPHDVMHMVVEAELGLNMGVFGQIAAGGLAGTFRVKLDDGMSKREGSRQQKQAKAKDEKLCKAGLEDSAISERATYLCWYEWLSRSRDSAHRNSAQLMAANAEHVRKTAPRAELDALNAPVIDRICSHLDLLSDRWSHLLVGEKMTVKWPDLTVS